MAQEAEQRCHASLLTLRDLRLLLLAMSNAASWAQVRRTVIDVLAGNPEQARQLLIMHTQIEVKTFWRKIRVPQRTGRVIVARMNVTGRSIIATARATSSPVAAV
ncbi:hypothetical protein [Streptomyces sp. AC555_RSS877]|uniref:hypothetical protein n=1 Tax=Streptomyces sp. AC555_RSS877 TaxID=2823688 RepID=UPI001C256DF6|nr:hypothetical protein [Streptomyces sp. AC555_RSS877]